MSPKKEQPSFFRGYVSLQGGIFGNTPIRPVCSWPQLRPAAAENAVSAELPGHGALSLHRMGGLDGTIPDTPSSERRGDSHGGR